MKKVFIGLGIVVLVLILAVAGVGYYVYSNLDKIVEQVIETAGTDAMGSRVEVDSVAIDLQEGDVSIYGFSVANPAGYSNGDMLRFDELSVDLDLSRLSGEFVGINSVVARSPFVRYEMQGRESNIGTVASRFESSEPAPQESSSSSDIRLAIDSVLVENIEASMASDLVNRELEVDLGDIRLENLEGTPEEIARQVMRPLMNQLASRASGAISELIGTDIQGLAEDQVEELRDQADERARELGEQLDEQLGEGATDRLREGVDNLLNRD